MSGENIGNFVQIFRNFSHCMCSYSSSAITWWPKIGWWGSSVYSHGNTQWHQVVLGSDINPSWGARCLCSIQRFGIKGIVYLPGRNPPSRTKLSLAILQYSYSSSIDTILNWLHLVCTIHGSVVDNRHFARSGADKVGRHQQQNRQTGSITSARKNQGWSKLEDQKLPKVWKPGRRTTVSQTALGSCLPCLRRPWVWRGCCRAYLCSRSYSHWSFLYVIEVLLPSSSCERRLGL